MQNDPAQEWQRMHDVYAQMNDDELQAVADEAYDLTDIAKEVLQAEISSRGADIKLQLEAPEQEAAPEPEIEEAKCIEEESESCDSAEFQLVNVRNLRDKEEARTAKWVLDNAGIPSWIGSQNVETVDEYKGSFDKGVALKVRDVDRDRATLAFVQHWPEDLNVASEPEPESTELDVRCPKCHSDEVVFESTEGETTDDSTLDTKFNWRCDACGHDWQDDGVEQEVRKP